MNKIIAQITGNDALHLGIISAFCSFLIWGFSPLYWRMLEGVSPYIIVAHRIFWSALFLMFLVSYQKRWPEVLHALSCMKTTLILAFTGALMASNWLIFIYAVNHNYVVESSLGYYISPLVSVFLGMIVLKEKLRSLQMVSVVFATAGVIHAIFCYGHFPWVALSLAITFSIYGLIRKVTNVASLPGMTIESMLLALPALLFIVLSEFSAQLTTNMGLLTILLLVGTGVVTTMPLILYNFGAKRIQFSTLGLLQYFAPTCMFLLGIFMFEEAFNQEDMLTFGFIWLGVLVYMFDSYLMFREKRTVIKKPVSSPRYVNISK